MADPPEVRDKTCCCWRYTSGRVCPNCYTGDHANCTHAEHNQPEETGHEG